MEQQHAIVLKPEIIGHIGDFPVSNTLMTSWLVMAILLTIGILAGRNVKMVPTGLQNFFEMILEAIYNTTEDLAHSKTKVFFPFLATFFLYIFFGNILGLFPGFGTITKTVLEDGHEVAAPLFRSINSDLNMTLGLALISAVVTHIFALRYLGLGDYLKRWFSLNPVFLFVGILELVGEFTKVVSLSFRLFGNIFAGEVVLTTVAKIAPFTAFIVPLPFYFLEIIVAFVQAAVFMMLTLVFMTLLTEKYSEH